MSKDLTVISPSHDTMREYFAKIWRYKYLIWVFAQRDIKVKYAQTALGIVWTLLQPLTSMVVFSFFFGYLLKWQTGSLPFPVYVLSGLICWNFFSYIVHSGSASVQESSHLIKKIYFPKSILPLSKGLVALTELLLSLIIFIPVLLYYDIVVSWKIIFFPFTILFTALCGLTLVFWIAAFSFRKRDLFHVLPFIVYFGIWITPVFFSADLLPEQFRFIVRFNPMANAVDLCRWTLFNENEFELYWLLSFAVTALVCVCGMFFYNRNENKFSDFA